jgi:hypothetical protein
MLQRIWDYKRECWTDEDVLADGEMLRVPLMLCDGAQRDVRDHFARDHFVRDALARHNGTAGHRPGFVTDTLCQSTTASVNDTSDDLLERRGTGLRDAMIEREKALADTEQRQQWRTVLDARMKVEAESDEDEEHDSDGSYDEDSDADIAGERDDLEALQARRERAYQESVTRSSNAWRTAGPANANQRQLERWRGK